MAIIRTQQRKGLDMTRYYIEARHINNGRPFGTKFGYATQAERDVIAKRLETNGCTVKLSERHL